MDEDKRKMERENVYKILGEQIDGIVTQACQRHYPASTQEHQFTAKIADRLDLRLNNLRIGDMKVSVHVQDFTDRGSKSQETKTGADLYISVVVDAHDEKVNKGMLVQSKWEDALTRSPKGLKPQTDKMKARTPSSYVWGYGPTGITVVPSEDVGARGIELSRSMTVGELIADGLRCNQGDPQIGRDLKLPPVESLNVIMEQLAADLAVSVELTELR